MKKICQFKLNNIGKTELLMPQGSKVLSVGFQHSIIYIWVLVNPDAPLVTKTFELYNTGEAINNIAFITYVGTVLLDRASFVLHCFEVS